MCTGKPGVYDRVCGCVQMRVRRFSLTTSSPVKNARTITKFLFLNHYVSRKTTLSKIRKGWKVRLTSGPVYGFDGLYEQ